MTIRSDVIEHKRYHTNDDYTKTIISEWTREETVEMNDATRNLDDIMDARNNKLNYGRGTQANSNDQVVFGKYNEPDNNNTYARITGGGTAAQPANLETLDWQGNFRVAGDMITRTGINLSDVLLLAHPVGSIYWSYNSTSPETLFGGRWTPIKNRFILAAGDGQTPGTTGGSEYVTFSLSGTTGGHNLIPDELPIHAHTYDKATGTGSHTLTENEIPNHRHSATLTGTTTGSTAQGKQDGEHTHGYEMYVPIAAPGGTDDENPIEIIQTGGHETIQTIASTHTHTVSVSGDTGYYGGSQGHSHTVSTDTASTSEVGNNAAHSHPMTVTATDLDEVSNMPPFEIAYCWRRIA